MDKKININEKTKIFFKNLLELNPGTDLKLEEYHFDSYYSEMTTYDYYRKNEYSKVTYFITTRTQDPKTLILPKGCFIHEGTYTYRDTLNITFKDGCHFSQPYKKIGYYIHDKDNISYQIDVNGEAYYYYKSYYPNNCGSDTVVTFVI